jgi:hypothetical protein
MHTASSSRMSSDSTRYVLHWAVWVLSYELELGAGLKCHVLLPSVVGWGRESQSHGRTYTSVQQVSGVPCGTWASFVEELCHVFFSSAKSWWQGFCVDWDDPTVMELMKCGIGGDSTRVRDSTLWREKAEPGDRVSHCWAWSGKAILWGSIGLWQKLWRGCQDIEHQLWCV